MTLKERIARAISDNINPDAYEFNPEYYANLAAQAALEAMLDGMRADGKWSLHIAEYIKQAIER